VYATSGTGAVELMRTMMAKSKKAGHLWPMAMYSWEVMPPPASLEKNLGERRLTGYAGTGWSTSNLLFVGVYVTRWRIRATLSSQANLL